MHSNLLVVLAFLVVDYAEESLHKNL